MCNAINIYDLNIYNILHHKVNYSKNIIHYAINGTYITLMEEFKRIFEKVLLKRFHFSEDKLNEKWKIAKQSNPMTKYEDIVIDCAIKELFQSAEERNEHYKKWKHYNNIENAIKHYDNNTDYKEMYNKEFCFEFLQELSCISTLIYNTIFNYTFGILEEDPSNYIMADTSGLLYQHRKGPAVDSITQFAISGLLVEFRSFMEGNKIKKSAQNLLKNDANFTSDDKKSMLKSSLDWAGHGHVLGGLVYDGVEFQTSILNFLSEVFPNNGILGNLTQAEFVKLSNMISDLEEITKDLSLKDFYTKISTQIFAAFNVSEGSIPSMIPFYDDDSYDFEYEAKLHTAIAQIKKEMQAFAKKKKITAPLFGADAGITAPTPIMQTAMQSAINEQVQTVK